MNRFPLVTVKANAREQRCGECQACCTTVGVTEIHKPQWQSCAHQCASGCGIYAERPPSCQSYYCLWLTGILPHPENRPDRLGLVMDFRTSDDATLGVISCWEVWEGAASQPRAREILRGIAKKFAVLIRLFRSNRRKVLGPEHITSRMVIQEIDEPNGPVVLAYGKDGV